MNHKPATLSDPVYNGHPFLLPNRASFVSAIAKSGGDSPSDPFTLDISCKAE
jgi:hypothetical protein